MQQEFVYPPMVRSSQVAARLLALRNRSNFKKVYTGQFYHCPNHLIFVASSISRTDVGLYRNLDIEIARGTLKYQSILNIF
jgi:hypothetical protein